MTRWIENRIKNLFPRANHGPHITFDLRPIAPPRKQVSQNNQQFITKSSLQHLCTTHLDEVLARHRSVVSFAIFCESRNRNATIVVRADSGNESISNTGSCTLETSRSARVDDDVRRCLVDGVECSQRGCVWSIIVGSA